MIEIQKIHEMKHKDLKVKCGENTTVELEVIERLHSKINKQEWR